MAMRFTLTVAIVVVTTGCGGPLSYRDGLLTVIVSDQEDDLRSVGFQLDHPDANTSNCKPAGDAHLGDDEIPTIGGVVIKDDPLHGTFCNVISGGAEVDDDVASDLSYDDDGDALGAHIAALDVRHDVHFKDNEDGDAAVGDRVVVTIDGVDTTDDVDVALAGLGSVNAARDGDEFSFVVPNAPPGVVNIVVGGSLAGIDDCDFARCSVSGSFFKLLPLTIR